MKKLLITTVILAATGYPALAQENTDMFRAEADPMAFNASDFIGMRVYRVDDPAETTTYMGIQDGWDDIGEIEDIVISRDGSVDAVLVDIGGFLGMGENRVALSMDAIRFASDTATADDDSDFFLVLNVPRETLQQAPTYTESRMMEQAEAMPEPTGMATDTAASGDQTMSDDRLMPTVREGFVALEAEDLTAERLTGAPAYDTEDKWVGEVSEILLSDEGRVRSVIVDVGGFLGIGEKPVELQLSSVDILRSDDGSEVRVYIALTKEQMEAIPKYEG
ncbi:PRC-barrel domain-containing protein [Defluviimonas sp. WL0002]|uniref:PRC-barrel domain-containing protein n=1 Tax=Albidovulum marisflavi TaxID=2984159 RepID=A0ABT2ZDB5_9RHOB|nr:PRC-barrel domain-containing protein [Defluviimonas sp. WL0002]MCV2869096.1 PRC-barrel domain-containing protein [Defluviimonas sp. WL0002]